MLIYLICFQQGFFFLVIYYCKKTIDIFWTWTWCIFTDKHSGCQGFFIQSNKSTNDNSYKCSLVCTFNKNYLVWNNINSCHGQWAFQVASLSTTHYVSQSQTLEVHFHILRWLGTHWTCTAYMWIVAHCVCFIRHVLYVLRMHTLFNVPVRE